MTTDTDDVAVREIGGSLTSVTWGEELVDVLDSSGVDKHGNVDDCCIASMMFDDDFSLNLPQAAGTVQRRTSRSVFQASRQSWPDSDSDTEDFLNVVLESRKAFVFTETTLEQFHRDHVEGTVVHDPTEYV